MTYFKIGEEVTLNGVSGIVHSIEGDKVTIEFDYTTLVEVEKEKVFSTDDMVKMTKIIFGMPEAGNGR